MKQIRLVDLEKGILEMKGRGHPADTMIVHCLRGQLEEIQRHADFVPVCRYVTMVPREGEFGAVIDKRGQVYYRFICP